VFADFGEWNFIMLRSAARFVSNENVQTIMDTLDFIKTRDSKESNYYSDSDDRLTRLEICKFTEGDEEYSKKLYENIDIDEVREILIAKALENNDYHESERLCLEKIASIEQKQNYSVYHWSRNWYTKLFEIYSSADDKEKQMELARKLLLDKRDTHYYEILKELIIKNGKWEKEYPIILEVLSKTLSANSFMCILQDENETELLLEQLLKQPQEVYNFGEKLVTKYPEKIYDLYSQIIREEAEEAGERKSYRKVCKRILELNKLGGVENARLLVNEFLEKYYRRPAMIDELQKIENRL